MDNNLKKIEKDLRAFAKRCKDIKYTQMLLFVFLLTGLLSLAAPADSVETARRDLNTSITDMKKLFKEAKQENNKLMKGSNLELIQLMEQGDHVVKSPWSSWQYGMNYFYGDWTGTYRGRGDKTPNQKYERFNSKLNKINYANEDKTTQLWFLYKSKNYMCKLENEKSTKLTIKLQPTVDYSSDFKELYNLVKELKRIQEFTGEFEKNKNY